MDERISIDCTYNEKKQQFEIWFANNSTKTVFQTYSIEDIKKMLLSMTANFFMRVKSEINNAANKEEASSAPEVVEPKDE